MSRTTPAPTDPDPAWLSAQARQLAELAARSAHPDGGFGWLSADNTVDLARPVETWITCRMTHVLALETMRGAEHLRPMLDVGAEALEGRLRDAVHGGWFPAVGGGAPQPTDKLAYAHAFVVLAAASLTAAEHPRGPDLLAQALAVFDTWFWDEQAGMAREQYDATWSTCEDYRGVNANMHTVEAMLAAGEVLGSREHVDRAARIMRRVVHQIARGHDWRLPEHFDRDWTELPDYNRDRPADPFRPYGVTIGHVLEWGRLAVNVRAAVGEGADEWLLTDAQALFQAAVSRGWAVDGADGFVYTTDFQDRPVVAHRLHWVVCEGIAAAWALYDATGDAAYRAWHERLWRYAQAHLLDEKHGGWRHELDPANNPSETVWSGKPDVYHAYQCALVPLLPGMASFAGAIRARGATG
jgi:mannose/cellobiose epimerase-like protein (N-acyl-D-glucosamine 2-epimerase family)